MKRRLTIYFFIPLAVIMALIGAYFSGVPWLQAVVSPRIPWMDPNSSREFGLLENLQHMVLLGMVATAVLAARRKERRIEKVGWCFIAAGALFVFLEEIDYGLHFYEYAMRIPWTESRRVRNLHNIGDNTDLMKRVADIGIGIVFVIMPLVLSHSKRPLLRYVSPDRFALLTVITMVIARTVAHGLRDAGFGAGGTIDKNISEFRELLLYYLVAVYLIDLAFFRTWEGAAPHSQDSPREDGP